MFNINSRTRYAWIVVPLMLLGIALALSSVPKFRSGLAIVESKATGALPDVGWMDLFRMIRPGTHFNLPELAKNPNPYATIRNPYNSAADISAGTDLFQSHCATCHGSDGSGGPGGPALQSRRMVQAAVIGHFSELSLWASAEPQCHLVICTGKKGGNLRLT